MTDGCGLSVEWFSTYPWVTDYAVGHNFSRIAVALGVELSELFRFEQDREQSPEQQKAMPVI